MKKQLTHTVLMVRPASFRLNEETAVNNYFQKKSASLESAIQLKAVQEFDAFVALLQSKGIQVVVVEDDPSLNTPDALFPNNWVSFHQDGRLALYPMFAENRRRERREEVLFQLEEQGFLVDTIVDYTSAEEENLFLEGTGSLVLDRVHRKAYCAISPRADEDLVIEFCEDFEYMPIIFEAMQTVNNQRLPIYHTNVMMCIGDHFAVICLASIDDKSQCKTVVNSLKNDGKEIIEITEEQMHHFAGNMLQVQSATTQETYLVMSKTAHQSLTTHQINAIEKHTTILSADLHTIEVNGGGSARCMLAEVFLPKQQS